MELATYEAWCRGKVDDDTYNEALDWAIRSALCHRYETDIPVPKSGRPGYPMRSAKRVGNKPPAPGSCELTGAGGVSLSSRSCVGRTGDEAVHMPRPSMFDEHRRGRARRIHLGPGQTQATYLNTYA